MKHKKPIILFVGPIPPPYSGPELSMQLFLESKLLNETFQIEFLKTNFRIDNNSKGKFDFLMFINFFVYFFRLIRILITKRVDCVYYPITPTQVGWIGRDIWTILLSKFFKTRIIIHLRGSHFKLNFEQFNFIVKRLVSFSLKKVNKAIVQAKYLKDQFLPFIPKSKVEVLYQGIDAKEYTNESVEEVELQKILIVGHMTKAKGYTDILKIIPDICQEFPNATFYFAGNIRKGERGVFFNQYNGKQLEYEDPFEAEKLFLSSQYKKNYVNLGVISGKEKMKHFRTTDIFLSASYSEGFSRSLLEAMAFGKPLVYSLVGAHREVLKDQVNGYAFKPGNLKDLMTAIKKMLENPKREVKFGLPNRANVVSNFTINRISNEFKSIILNTIEI